MKKFICISILLCFLAYLADCQIIKPKETIKRKAEDRANTKADGTIDKALDKVEEGIGNLFKKKNKKPETTASETTVNAKAGKGFEEEQQTGETFKMYSKFDFVSGEKILYYNDFETVDIGDFPADFNTDASGEVMNVESKPGKWLALTKNGSFMPEGIATLPENFTLEFNVGILGDPSNNMTGFGLNFNTNKDNLMKYRFISGSFVSFHPGGSTANLSVSIPDGTPLENEFAMPQWNVENNRFARISLWRQKGRLRVYVNENKLMDIPRFFVEQKPYQLSFYRDFFNECNLLVSDLKFAVGSPDTRNKLLTTGKFSTTGILFDFQKATVRPESFGIIKEIATVLKENAAVKVKVVGHTSNDGDAAANLQLSKQRSLAVKNILVKEFGIAESRLETDGKGGTELVDKTNTAEGKANNRRVEFIKLPQ